MATLFLFFPNNLLFRVLVLLISLHGSLYYEDHVVTSRLPFDATAQQVKDALEALSNIGKGGLLRVERNQGKVPRLLKVHLKVHIER